MEEQGSWQPVKRPGGGGSDEATKRPKDSTTEHPASGNCKRWKRKTETESGNGNGKHYNKGTYVRSKLQLS